jgi:hypothetical protein
MKKNLTTLASIALLGAFAAHAEVPVAPDGGAGDGAKKKHHVRVVKKSKPTVQMQLDELRTQMQTQMDSQKAQIDSLQSQLSSSQQQLASAQTQAQTAIQQASDALAQQQAQTQQNTQAVATLQSSVSDLTTNSQSLASTLQADQAQTKKMIENPDVVHFKGVGINFTNSFIEFATVNRTRATASDIPTPFTAIPFSASTEGNMSEFYATGRQSRLAISAVGKVPWANLQAYYELDWLGTGITSNNNQSNSYVMRERQLWAQAALHNGWTFTGGQQWTLATETRHALDNKTEILPDTIDPNYNVGFVWARQPGMRVTKNFANAFTVGISAEQAQTLTPSCQASGTVPGSNPAVAIACPVNYTIGTNGTNGGLYNATALYSFNLAPDLIAKVAGDSPALHWELFGVGRFFRNRVYPTAGTIAGGYNDTTIGGGVGGGVRFYAAQKKVELGLHGLYGDGTGRYASAQLADTTLRPDGQLALLHNEAALGEVFVHATPRLDIYGDWGFEEVGRRIFVDGPGFEGYGLRTSNDSGCGTPGTLGAVTSGAYPPPTAGFTIGGTGTCQSPNKDVTEGTVGYDYYFYKGPAGRFRQGFQFSWIERALWSGAQGTSPKATDELFETNIRYYLP